MAIGPDGPDGTVQARLGVVLSRLDPAPGLVINRVGDVIAATRVGRLLFGPIGMLDPPGNLSRYVFTDPRARSAFPDWDSVADRVATQLRLDTCDETEPLIEEMSRVAGAEFADRIATPLVMPDRHGYVQLNHPTAGLLRLTYETLDLFIDEPQHLLLYLAADEASTESLQRLGSGPGGTP
ncbi:hypothetical protein [Microlunatus sp. GCM10028923]|uniref:MmyB family transcriptional regulator n=1 Tax=Microlunatus sp. GCM10028923 TaxID=3273400 RepID=UPI0036209515